MDMEQVNGGRAGVVSRHVSWAEGIILFPNANYLLSPIATVDSYQGDCIILDILSTNTHSLSYAFITPSHTSAISANTNT